MDKGPLSLRIAAKANYNSLLAECKGTEGIPVQNRFGNDFPVFRDKKKKMLYTHAVPYLKGLL